MTLVYAESSVVLSWLLGEAGQHAVVDELAKADRVVTSILTLIECGRGLSRARQMKRITETEELAALRLLDGVVGAWDVLSVSDHVAEIARGAFPNEPVRTLDALHLASARVLSDAMGPLHMLSLDDRLRRNAAELGMELRP